MVSGTRCPAGSDPLKMWSESRAAAPKGRCPATEQGIARRRSSSVARADEAMWRLERSIRCGDGVPSPLKQRVRVEDELSEWIEVLSGVVQGSVLGGILFDIFIDNIDLAALEAHNWKFANDTKAAMVIDSEEDGTRMQAIVDSLGAWAKNGACPSTSTNVKYYMSAELTRSFDTFWTAKKWKR